MKQVAIILCKVDEEPALVGVNNDLPTFRKLVGGNLEAARLGGRVFLMCNADGYGSLPANRLVYPHGLICGDFLLSAGDDQGETVTLTRAEAQEWLATARGWERATW